MNKPFTLAVIALLALVAVLHAIRAALGWGMIINGVDIPVWASVVGSAVTALLAVMLWKESRP